MKSPKPSNSLHGKRRIGRRMIEVQYISSNGKEKKQGTKPPVMAAINDALAVCGNILERILYDRNGFVYTHEHVLAYSLSIRLYSS